MERASRSLSLRPGLALVALLVIVGALLRLSVCFNDLWFDELWSLSFAGRAASPLDVLLRIHHDNNHKINTLFMAALGQDAPGFLYRLPSLLAGCGAIVLAGRIACRWGKREGIIAIALAALSYLLIHYASEARGYSLALFFAFAAFLYLERFLETRRPAAALGFGLGTIFGLLSHLTCIHFYLGALAWSAVRIGRERAPAVTRLRAFGACHALPAAFLVALYLVDVRWMTIGGGDPRPLPQVAVNAVALTVGMLPDRPVAALAAAAAAFLFGAGLVAFGKDGSDRWICFLVTVLLSPALLLACHQGVVYERYFLISAAFMLLPIARALAAATHHGRAERTAVAVVLLCVTAGNLSLVRGLQRDGRGGYREALRFVGERTPRATITISSDHDFRNLMLLNYYGRELPAKRIVYFTAGAWPEGGPEWYIAHRQNPAGVPPGALQTGGLRYRLARVFPSSRLSGWHWYLYQRGSVRHP